MHKAIISIGFFFALLSTVILQAKGNTESNAKTFETVSAQFSHHIPETQQPCNIGYLF